jgi:hypothetical protein
VEISQGLIQRPFSHMMTVEFSKKSNFSICYYLTLIRKYNIPPQSISMNTKTETGKQFLQASLITDK